MICVLLASFCFMLSGLAADSHALPALQEHAVGGIRAADFGAIPGDTIDDTAAIQRAVDRAQVSGGNVEFDGGTYLLSRQGSILGYDGKNRNYYAVLISASVTLNGNGARFEIDEGDAHYATAFLADGADRVRISNMSFVGLNAVRAAKYLFTGVGVALNNSSNSIVEKIHAQSMRGGVHFYRCTNCLMRDNVSELEIGNHKVSGTHFGVYSGSDNTIDSCVAYVASGDGDIFLYGSGYKNTIRNSKAFNHARGDSARVLVNAIGQGMGADSGQRYATIEGNHVYGYFYGIDVKNDSDGAKVVGNTTMQNKVGISVRLGDASHRGRSYGVVVANNIVNVAQGMTQFEADPIYGKALGAANYGGGVYKSAGIFLENSTGHAVTGNVIYTQGMTAATPGFRNDFVGIHLQNDGGVDESVQKGTVITGNHISHQTVIGQNNYYSRGAAIYVTNGANKVNKVSGIAISGNRFDSYYGAAALSALVSIEDASQAVVSGNSFGYMRGSPLISVSRSNRVTISNNSTQAFRQFAAIVDSSNINIVGNVLGGNNSRAFEGELETIGLRRCAYINVGSNVAGEVTSDDGKFLNARDSNWITMSANVVASRNWGAADYYSFDASAVNVVVVNNLVD